MSEFIILCFVLLLGVGCGGSGQPEEKAPAPPANDPAFVKIKATVDRDCGRCHNGRVHPLVFSTPASFKTARVQALVSSGRMPPDRALSASAKAELLGYLGR